MPPEERKGRGRYRGRGLCSACYQRAARTGFQSTDRVFLTRDDLFSEVEHVLLDGPQKLRTIADRIGYKPESLSQALRRSAKAGDSRAIRIRERLLPWDA